MLVYEPPLPITTRKLAGLLSREVRRNKRRRNDPQSWNAIYRFGRGVVRQLYKSRQRGCPGVERVDRIVPDDGTDAGQPAAVADGKGEKKTWANVANVTTTRSSGGKVFAGTVPADKARSVAACTHCTTRRTVLCWPHWRITPERRGCQWAGGANGAVVAAL